MNTVKITDETKPTPKYQLGDILTSGSSHYILNSTIATQIDGQSKVFSCANNIETGAPWKRLTENISWAVDGLYFVGRKAEITIKFSSDK